MSCAACSATAGGSNWHEQTKFIVPIIAVAARGLAVIVYTCDEREKALGALRAVWPDQTSTRRAGPCFKLPLLDEVCALRKTRILDA